MHKLTAHCLAITLALLIIAPIVEAYTYDTEHLPYTDAPTDKPTAVAVSLLTELQIVQGNPDGTFRPNALLNRAEYMKIVMGLEPFGGEDFPRPCFPDVPLNAWYTEPVCRAKELGIVRGNADPSKPQSQWRFEPERSVLYAEAVKVLVEIYDLPLTTVAAGQWYEPYMIAARRANLALPDVTDPGHALTRGEMARLVARFVANEIGELNLLFAAQITPFSSSSSSSVSSSSASSESSISSPIGSQSSSSSVSTGTGSQVSTSSSSSSLAGGVVYDPQPPVIIDDAFLLLGEESEAIGSVKVFSEHQPLIVDRLLVRLMSATPSVEAMHLYDGQGRYLGRATLDQDYPGDRQYQLSFKPDELIIPKGEEYSFYARAEVKSLDAGGVSGQAVQVHRMGVEGTGGFNNKSQTSFSSETFPVHQTAAAEITSITNDGPTEDILIPGYQQRIGVFRFEGVTSEPSANLELKRLQFQVNQTGGISLSNTKLMADGFNDSHNCTVNGSVIICDNLPAIYGSLEDSARRISIHADVSVASNNQTLQLSLNEPGSYSSGGAIRWTDGTSTFNWVDFDQPIVRSSALRN